MKTKTTKIAGMIVLALGLMSFTNLKEIKVDAEKSNVTWKGYKVTGEHEGTISIKSGTILMDGDKLTGGTFVIDMTTINTTDLSGDSKGKLDGHLKSGDFFGVEKNPTATLVITKAEGSGNTYTVTGDLTIKGITNPVTFPMSINGNTAKADVKIDRTKYDIKYGSASFFDNLKDKAIYDEFDLNVNLTF